MSYLSMQDICHDIFHSFLCDARYRTSNSQEFASTPALAIEGFIPEKSTESASLEWHATKLDGQNERMRLDDQRKMVTEVGNTVGRTACLSMSVHQRLEVDLPIADDSYSCPRATLPLTLTLRSRERASSIS